MGLMNPGYSHPIDSKKSTRPLRELLDEGGRRLMLPFSPEGRTELNTAMAAWNKKMAAAAKDPKGAVELGLDVMSLTPAGAVVGMTKKVAKAASKLDGATMLKGHLADGGGTWNPKTGQPITKGYAVSAHKERELVIKGQPTAKQMQAYLNKNKDIADDGGIVGSWFNKDDGNTYLDMVDVTDDLKKATSQGRRLKEKAIFNLSTKEEIPVELGQSIKGVHFSKAQRETLDGRKAGTGIPSEERKRLIGADPRINERIDFYTGDNIRPEQGLGSFKHEVNLENMYDAGKNPLGIKFKDFNDFESQVVDLGFAGYTTDRGRAVLLGPASRGVKPSAPTVAPSLIKLPEGQPPPPGLLATPEASVMVPFDPRIDTRVKEQARLSNLSTTIEPRGGEIPQVNLTDFEGRPFVTSMADRTAARGLLTGVNDTPLNNPVDLRGGQDYMFDPASSGDVWASGVNPAKSIMSSAQNMASLTGQNPLFIPWRMAPSAGDFSNMTGETMLAYSSASMGKGSKKALDKSLGKFMPGWLGVDNPESIAQFRAAPDTTRKAVKNMMDTNFRDRGGLGIGEARMAVADPKQLSAADGGIMNVGEIFAGSPLNRSSHPSYPMGIPGQGLGVLQGNQNIFSLLPDAAQSRGLLDVNSPRTTDLRALQMKPYSGIITEAMLRKMGY